MVLDYFRRCIAYLNIGNKHLCVDLNGLLDFYGDALNIAEEGITTILAGTLTPRRQKMLQIT